MQKCNHKEKDAEILRLKMILKYVEEHITSFRRYEALNSKFSRSFTSGLDSYLIF